MVTKHEVDDDASGQTTSSTRARMESLGKHGNETDGKNGEIWNLTKSTLLLAQAP